MNKQQPIDSLSIRGDDHTKTCYMTTISILAFAFFPISIRLYSRFSELMVNPLASRSDEISSTNTGPSRDHNPDTYKSEQDRPRLVSLTSQDSDMRTTSEETYNEQSLSHPIRHPPTAVTSERSTDGNTSPVFDIPSYFSIDMSTEENYKVDNFDFYGPFRSIRSSLDYSYHGNYTQNRQQFQDRIIQQLLNGTVVQDTKNGIVCRTPTEPWIVFTAGVMGAGKSHTIKQLASQGDFPLHSYVSVDPDEIRHHFPEFHLYASLSRETAGERTHKEAGYVTEIVTAVGLQRGYNVLVDGSLRDYEWYIGYFERLKLSHRNLRIAILHVTAPREKVFERARLRAAVTGRVVPQETLEKAIQQVPISVKKLAPTADFFCEVDNSQDSGELTIKTPGVDWDSFRNVWLQTCPWPGMGQGA